MWSVHNPVVSGFSFNVRRTLKSKRKIIIITLEAPVAQEVTLQLHTRVYNSNDAWYNHAHTHTHTRTRIANRKIGSHARRSPDPLTRARQRQLLFFTFVARIYIRYRVYVIIQGRVIPALDVRIITSVLILCLPFRRAPWSTKTRERKTGDVTRPLLGYR